METAELKAVADLANEVDSGGDVSMDKPEELSHACQRKRHTKAFPSIEPKAFRNKVVPPLHLVNLIHVSGTAIGQPARKFGPGSFEIFRPEFGKSRQAKCLPDSSRNKRPIINRFPLVCSSVDL
jgi:hypothetical protein